MESFYIHVLAEDHVIIRGECVSMVLPLVDGLCGIQANHVPMISAVVPGELRCTMADGTLFTAAVSNGLVKVENNDVLVLVESGDQDHDLDALKARRAAEEAEAARRSQKSNQEYRAAQATLIRATNKLRSKGKNKHEKKY